MLCSSANDLQAAIRESNQSHEVSAELVETVVKGMCPNKPCFKSSTQLTKADVVNLCIKYANEELVRQFNVRASTMVARRTPSTTAANSTQAPPAATAAQMTGTANPLNTMMINNTDTGVSQATLRTNDPTIAQQALNTVAMTNVTANVEVRVSIH